MLKIKPLQEEIQIKLDKVEVGNLDTSSRKSAIEFAEVMEVGKGIEELKKGDKVFVKSWAIDHISHEGKDYDFVSLKTRGIKAIVK